MKKLAELGKEIKLGLDCDINEIGVPCRTDRFAVVDGMKEYLELHGYVLLENN